MLKLFVSKSFPSRFKVVRKNGMRYFPEKTGSVTAVTYNYICVTCDRHAQNGCTRPNMRIHCAQNNYPGRDRMAKAQLSILVSDLRNKIGNVVFSKWKQSNYVRQYVKHGTGNTEGQIIIRDNFSIVVTVWKALCDAMRATWTNAAKSLNMSGYNLFIGDNATHLLKGTSMEMAKASIGVHGLFTFSAAPAASGAVQCSFTVPDGSETSYLVLVAQKMVEGKPGDVVSLVNGGVNPVSPYTLTGLEPGVQYTVHAMLADNEFAKAKTVSGSLSAVTTAGA